MGPIARKRHADIDCHDQYAALAFYSRRPALAVRGRAWRTVHCQAFTSVLAKYEDFDYVCAFS